MDFYIEKDKLPKGMSYPLKSSVLKGAFEEADIDIEISLHIGTFAWFLDAHFWPAGGNFNYDRLYVRAGAVDKKNARNAKYKMEQIVIPKLTTWALEKIALNELSPLRYKNNVLFFQ